MKQTIRKTPHFSQQGVGLIEVLVSLLLLAIAILGYSALQARAISTTSESLTRTNAMNIVTSLVEKMRYNPSELATYQAQLNAYDDSFNGGTAKTDPTNCYTEATGCSTSEQAAFDSFIAAQAAFDSGFRLQMTVCPGTGGNVSGSVMELRCVIASWNDTLPVYGTDSATSCMNQSTSTYFNDAQCLMMEAM